MAPAQAYRLSSVDAAACAAKLAAMDESVLAAMAKWPDVPHVYGWLSLTARGQWRLRGEPIVNEAIRDFIERNYAGDERGCWYFQNGPQRVYVALEVAPWVYRLQADGTLCTFNGRRPRQLLDAALLDGATFVVHTDIGPGNVDDRDAGAFLAALTDGSGTPLAESSIERLLADGERLCLSAARLRLGDAIVPVRRLDIEALAAAFGFVRQPQAPRTS